MVILPHSGGDKFSAEKIQKQKRYFFDHFAKTKQQQVESQILMNIRDTHSHWKTKKNQEKQITCKFCKFSEVVQLYAARHSM